MKKYILPLLTVLLPMVAFADAVEIDGIYYNLVPSTKEAEVTINPNEYTGDVVIPASVTFDGVDFSVTSIGSYSFFSCKSLTSISIPNSVTKIGDMVFSYCSSLSSIRISDIAAWCSIKFSGMDSNPLSSGGKFYLNDEEIKELTIPNSVTSIGQFAFTYCKSLSSVSIPDGVTSIGGNAFSYCSNLTSITIPNSVTSIGQFAFTDCSSLTSVVIPDGITIIEFGLFTRCSSLTSVTIPNSVTKIGDSAFYGCSSLTTVTLPDGVSSIGKSAFSNCSGLTSIAIPDGVSELGEMAFMYCSNLASIKIPDGVTKLGESTFHGCSSLITIVIPNGVTVLEYGVFSQCRSLTSATIGGSVKTIKKNSFTDCPALADVYCLAENVPSTDLYAFDSYILQAILHVPSNAVDAYMAQEPWRFFQCIVPLDDESIETIFYNSPTGCTTIDIYSIDGKLIGSAADQSEAACIVNHLPSGTTAIVRMGGKSVKVVVR